VKELIQSELTTLPFLAEKRLVILEDFMVKTVVEEGEDTATNQSSQIEQWLIDNIE
jgi:hypothetical protein